MYERRPPSSKNLIIPSAEVGFGLIGWVNGTNLTKHAFDTNPDESVRRAMVEIRNAGEPNLGTPIVMAYEAGVNPSLIIFTYTLAHGLLLGDGIRRFHKMWRHYLPKWLQ